MLKKSMLAAAAATLLVVGCEGVNNLSPEANVTIYVTDGLAVYTIKGTSGLRADQKTLTGLDDGTLLYALDINPSTGKLNGIGSNGQSYQIDPSTGATTKAAARETTNNLANKAVEIDYNPVVATQNVYRVTTSTGENFRVNDTSGSKAAGGTGAGGNDLQFFYKTGDANASQSVVVSGIAYTDSQINNGKVPPSTTVYAIETNPKPKADGSTTLAVLARLGGLDPNATDRSAACPNDTNPNCGQLTTIGELGIDLKKGFVAFDILSKGVAGSKATRNIGYVTALQGGAYNLYSIDLATGKLSLVALLSPTINPIRAMAVQP